ncbi:MAG TPA: hypothetical protein VM509_14485 [Planctomycetota bacterium]|nr:hypothetical protein [Planctomycetota bacterium]
MADKTVTGKKSGVNAEILDFLALVAKHGGKDIVIKDGKRDASTQAERMWKNWTGTVDRGRVYVAGKSLTEANRKLLDDDWNIGHDAKKSAEDKKAAEARFRALAAKTPSLHVSGKAVDLDEGSLTAPMKKVLEKYMKRVQEKGCYHLQFHGKLPEEDVIKKELGVKLTPA